MKVLAVDHGTARAGIAICDPSGTVVRPLGVVEPPEPAEVASLVTEHEVGAVVVGLPVSLDGAEGPQAARAREFRDALATLVAVPVDIYDERLTTRLAEDSVRAGAEAPADALAAAHLLESYLEATRGRGREAEDAAGE